MTTNTPPPAAPRPSSSPKLEGYRILGEMGRDDFGVAYKAEQLTLQRPVAIRTLESLPGLDNEARLTRLMEATREAAGIRDHTNLAKVFDVKRYGAVPCVVMEYVEGETLDRKLVLLGGAFKPAKAVDAAIQMARGLARAHAGGAIHGALKPSGALVASNWIVKLMDFGVAKGLNFERPATTTGAALYMAPELWESKAAEKADARSDVYALAGILYQMLAGRPPFSGDTVDALAKAHASTPPPSLRTADPKFSRDLERIVLKGLEKKPENRFQTAEDFEKALNDYAEQAGMTRETASGASKARQTFKFGNNAPKPFQPREGAEEYPIPGDMEDMDMPPGGASDDADEEEEKEAPFFDLLDEMANEAEEEASEVAEETSKFKREDIADVISRPSSEAYKTPTNPVPIPLAGGGSGLERRIGQAIAAHNAAQASFAPTQAMQAVRRGSSSDMKAVGSGDGEPKKKKGGLFKLLLLLIFLVLLLGGGVAGLNAFAPAQMEQILRSVDPNGQRLRSVPAEWLAPLGGPLAAAVSPAGDKKISPDEPARGDGPQPAETPRPTPAVDASAGGEETPAVEPSATPTSDETPETTSEQPPAAVSTSEPAMVAAATPEPAMIAEATPEPRPAAPLKPSLAVADFAVGPGIDPNLGASLAVNLLPDLGGNEFRLAQRSRLMRGLQGSQFAAESIASNQEAALTAARKEGLAYVATGSLERDGNRWRLTVRLVNVSSGEVAGEASQEAATLENLRWQLPALAKNLRETLPMS
jgi:serine/threonine protein kinase/TolB-like protein